jgi:hypothetical protein
MGLGVGVEMREVGREVHLRRRHVVRVKKQEGVDFYKHWL